MKNMRRLPLIGAAFGVLVLVGGCQVDGSTGRDTLTGAGVGAAGGAVVGLFTGNALEGAAIGAAAGAASGFVANQLKQ